LVCHCKFSYPLTPPTFNKEEDAKREWKVENIGVENLIATNVPKLGLDHPISAGMCVFMYRYIW